MMKLYIEWLDEQVVYWQNKHNETTECMSKNKDQDFNTVAHIAMIKFEERAEAFRIAKEKIEELFGNE